jgi:lysophospholipase L1-like esterase
MAVITTGNHPKALWPGVHAWFGAVYNNYPAEYPMLFDEKSSTRNFEEDVEQTSFGLAPIKPEGSATSYDSHQQGYTKRYVHVAYALGYIVTREELADNLYREVSMNRAQSLAFSMSQTRENVGANIYNRAFTAAYAGGDGKELLATDHPALSGTFSNELATPAALAESSIEDLCVQIMNATNSRGLKISLRPTKLIVSTANAFEAERILKSDKQNDTANNAVNALKSKGAIPTYDVNHYLSASTPNYWFVRTNAPNGMCWMNRETVSFTKDMDFDTDNAKAKAYMRFSAGWTDPRGLYGSAAT